MVLDSDDVRAMAAVSKLIHALRMARVSASALNSMLGQQRESPDRRRTLTVIQKHGPIPSAWRIASCAFRHSIRRRGSDPRTKEGIIVYCASRTKPARRWLPCS